MSDFDIFHITGFKIGGEESCSQWCLVSLSRCPMLDEIKVIRYSEYEKQISQLKSENKDLKEKVEKLADALEEIAEYPVIPDLKHVIDIANRALKELSNE